MFWYPLAAIALAIVFAKLGAYTVTIAVLDGLLIVAGQYPYR
jgi:hypothetical protein